MTRLLGVLLALLACGCLHSTHHLGEGAIDPAVLGEWRDPRNAQDRFVLEVISQDGKEQLVRRAVQPKSPQLIHPHTTFIPTRIGSGCYASFLTGDEHKLYQFLRYEIKGDSLMVWVPSHEALGQAIAQGKLRGKVWSTTWGDNEFLEDDTDRLRKFVETASDDLWLPRGEYRRVNPAPPR